MYTLVSSVQFQIDSLKVNTSIIGDGLINISGNITAPVFNGSATSAKTIGGAFDIPHVKDEKKTSSCYR